MTPISRVNFEQSGIFWKKIRKYFSELLKKTIRKISITSSIAFHLKNFAQLLSMRHELRYLINSEIMKISRMRLLRKSKENETEEIRKYRIILN
jgi:hypothetical protein